LSQTPDAPDDRAAATAGPPSAADAGGETAVAVPPTTGSWIPALALALFGIVVSFELLIRTLALMQDRTPGGVDMCRALFHIGCDAALQNTDAWRFGVPAAGWGMAYFGALAWLAFMARSLGGWFPRRAAAAGLLFCVPGLIVSLLLVIAMFTGGVPVCPLCLVVHATNVALALVLWRTGRFGSGGLGGMLREAARWSVGPPGREPPEARWTVVGLATAAMMGLLVLQWSIIQVERRGGAAAVFDPTLVAKVYEVQPRVDIPVTPDDARMGPADAPAKIVVFSDFECPGCADFAPDLEAVVAEHPDKISMVFKHYPLSRDCNPAMIEDMHPGACEIAAASEAARLQGHFWAFHDLAFENIEGAADSVLRRMAIGSGCDVERFEHDRRDPAAMARVKADVDLGNKLKIDSTPTVFLNGRKLPELSKRALESLVEKILKASG
jgi:protein-disulfide isomerase/uncharacterized membrane protein